ncbi:hypothetical protein P7G51_11750 [Enterococcus asini]|uniref:hypothetical protein n=1 Tax=Enterococcus asini TaxID=57732 RepID=UPI00288E9A1C|nr:hypothetical protein [Enterococcus asini]MDT2758057.1 hypothetical protein [Enterococcus asini]
MISTVTGKFVMLVLSIATLATVVVPSATSVAYAAEKNDESPAISEQIDLKENDIYEISTITDDYQNANLEADIASMDNDEKERFLRGLQAADDYIDNQVRSNAQLRAFGIANWIVAGASNVAFSALCGGTGVITLVKYIAKHGVKAAKSMIVSVAKKWVAIKVANTVAGYIVGALKGFLSFSIGDCGARLWDRIDAYKNNGYCNLL